MLETTGSATRKRQQLSHIEQLQECLALGMRLREGVGSAFWADMCTELSLAQLHDAVVALHPSLAPYFATTGDPTLSFTPSGMRVLDAIVPHLALALDNLLIPTSKISSVT